VSGTPIPPFGADLAQGITDGTSVTRAVTDVELSEARSVVLVAGSMLMLYNGVSGVGGL
jgi:hypothetical protein